MVTDHERAWTELAEFVSSKTQHGREGLLTEMAQIAARCRVPEGELSRLLRLYGVEVERVRSIEAETGPADEDRFQAERVRAGIAPSRDIIDRGGHDGGRNGANGRREV